MSASKRCACAAFGAMRMVSPGLAAMRSRNTQVISLAPILATTCVSDPVGSITITSAGNPSADSWKCSGRMP